MAPIEIPLSKSKLSLMLGGSVAFLAMGLWLMIHQIGPNDPAWLSKPVAVTIGIVTIAFFGLCASIIPKKLRSKEPGFIISDEGITDNSSGLSAGPIPWKDVQGVKTVSTFNQRFILILIANPQAYIDRQEIAYKKKAMNLNYKMYGSPVCISANTLKCNFNELYSLLTQNLDNNKNAGLPES